MYDARIVVRISTRETDALGQFHLAITRHLDLHAIRVELRSTPGILRIAYFAFMQPDHLSADQVLSGFESRRYAYIHVAELLRNVAGGAPFAWLWERVAFDLAGVPELDERVISWGVGRYVDERGPMVRRGNDFVGIITKLVMPVEREVVSRRHFDSIVGLHVSHDVAAHVDGVEVLDWRVVVASTPVLTIVRGDADAFEGSLVDSVDKYALGGLELPWISNVEEYPNKGMSACLAREQRQEKSGCRSHGAGSRWDLGAERGQLEKSENPY